MEAPYLYSHKLIEMIALLFAWPEDMGTELQDTSDGVIIRPDSDKFDLFRLSNMSRRRTSLSLKVRTDMLQSGNDREAIMLVL